MGLRLCWSGWQARVGRLLPAERPLYHLTTADVRPGRAAMFQAVHLRTPAIDFGHRLV